MGCPNLAAGLELSVLLAISLLLKPTDAFLPSPGLRSTLSGPSRFAVNDLNSPLLVDETTEPSSSSTLNCEIIKLGEPPVIGEHEGISYEPGLTADQARAIALEAAVSKTVPKATIQEALHCLAHFSETDLSCGAAPAPVGAIDGVWRLCFCEGDFVQGINVDNHGYLGRDQELDIRFDCKNMRIALSSNGIRSSLMPPIVRGGMVYSPETQTVTGNFDEEFAGIGSLFLRACMVDEDALGFQTMLEGKGGFLLLHAERSKAAVARLMEEPPKGVSLPSKVTGGKKSATATVTGKKKLKFKVNLKLVSDEEVHDSKRMAVEEAGRDTGSFNTFIRYLETEGATIYAVLAGPVLFSFMRFYTPIAASKATVAAMVIKKTLMSYFGTVST